MLSHRAVLLALRAHATPVTPAKWAFENTPFTPTTGVAYVEEDYVPGPATLRTLAGPGGTVQAEPLYVLKWFDKAGSGAAILDGVSALLARFAPGTAITAADGTVVRVRGDTAPYASGVTTPEAGWAMVTVTIPCRVYTINPS